MIDNKDKMSGEFHIHTVASDGEFTVNEILAYVSGKRNYISITDHDVITSSIEAYKLNGKYNVTSIIGVEVSTFFVDNNLDNQDNLDNSQKQEVVHILGYFKNDEYLEVLTSFLQEVRKNRIQRLHAMNEKLASIFNIHLDCTNLLNRSSITRGSIATEIIAQGNPYTVEELFANVIGADCPAYIPASKLPTRFAIDLIHQAHGLAVLAHPVLLTKVDYKKVMALGCDGIEAIYPKNKDGDEKEFRRFAKENNKFITCGCDFHRFNDSKHADLLTMELNGEDLEIFIKKIENLK